MITYFILLLAIAAEIVATTALKLSYGFSKLYPSLVVFAGYSLSFWLMSITLKTLPISVVYAIWSGLGILGIALISVIYFGEAFGMAHFFGTLFIIAGVTILSLVTNAH